MIAYPFNSLGGYTIGIPPVTVVNSSGTVVANVNNDNVLANTVLTNNLKYSNGAPYVPGSNTQLIFNNSNLFGASANLTFNSTTNFLSTTNLAVTGITQLGNVGNVSILGGENGYFLQTDGTGNLTWTVGSNGGGGNGTPGGANTQVQYNNAGSFGGDAGFTYNENTNTLSIGNVNSNFFGNLTGIASNATAAVTVTANAQPNINSVGILTTLAVSGQVAAGIFQGSGANLTNLPAANLVGSVPLAVSVSNSAQPNITSVGTLTTLNVSGNISGANISSSNRMSTANLFVTGNTTVGGNITMTTGTFNSNGNVVLNGSSIGLGNVSNVKIQGGLSGQILTTDGAGNLSFANSASRNPASPNASVQYNSNGNFGGSAFFTFDDVNKNLNVNGNLTANSLQLGSGSFAWSTSFVFFATTNSSSAQVLYSVPLANISGVDFEIISTAPSGPSRQFCKINSLYYNGIVQFNEYASLFVNGGVGNFEVAYYGGNISFPPSLQLKITPNTSSTVSYKMLITTYAV